MKSRIVWTAMLLSIITAVNGFAQSKSKMTEEQKMEMIARYEAYKEKLNLTEEQLPEVQKINTDFFEHMADIRGANVSKREKFQKFRELKSQKDSKMKKLLTKEQYKLYVDYQEELKKNFIVNNRK